MMKNKKVLYILLPAALFLWGYIIYELVVTVGAEPDTAVVTYKEKPPKAEALNTPDTFSLLVNYKDPFLGKNVYRPKKNRPSATVTVKAPKKDKPVKELNWPEIKYIGKITNESSGKQVVAVKIAGRDYLLTEGETIAGIEIIEVYTDSLLLSYNNDQKAFIK